MKDIIMTDGTYVVGGCSKCPCGRDDNESNSRCMSAYMETVEPLDAVSDVAETPLVDIIPVE